MKGTIAFLPVSVAIGLLSYSSQGSAFLPCQQHIANHPSTNSRRLTINILKSKQSDEEEITGLASAKVRFSGFELDKQSASSTSATTSNPLDGALSLFTSDVASIGLGLIGLCLLLIERLSLPDVATMGVDQVRYAETLGEETRSNLIAVFACGSVLLNGISKLDVTSALAESVELEGTTLSAPLVFDDSLEKHQRTLEWCMESFLQATPAKTVVLLQRKDKWQIVSMAGVVPTEATDKRPDLFPTTPILDRFLKDGSSGETYLPTLQALPGKAEFNYIPENTEGVLILSVPQGSTASTTTTTILLGANRAKSFTPRDVAWCQTLASRLGSVL